MRPLRNTLDFDVVGPLAGLSQIIGELQLQACFVLAAERFGESDRRFRGHPSLAIDEIVQSLLRHA